MRKIYLLLTLLFALTASIETQAQCTAVATWSENFDAVTAPALPTCFVRMGAGGTVRTYAALPASTPNMFFIGTSTTVGRGVVRLPAVTNAGAGTHQLRWKMRYNSGTTSLPDIELGYFTSPTDTSSFVSLKSIVVTNGAYQEYTWRPGTVPTSQHLGMRVTAYGNGVLIDDMFWEAAPTTVECPPTIVRYEEHFNSTNYPGVPPCTSLQNAGNGMNFRTANLSGNLKGFSGGILYYPYHPNSAANAWWYTKGIQLTAGTQYFISYKYGNDSSAWSENLRVAYGTQALATSMTTVLATHMNINDETAHVNTVSFTPAATGTYYFGFNATSAADQSNLLLDSIVVDLLSSCPVPTGLTATNISSNGATISFAPVAGNTYEYYVGAAPPTGAGTPVATSPISLTGLTPNTSNTVWIRSICSGNTFSSWVQISFNTLCQSQNVPYTENFDNVTPPAIPVCTFTQNAGSGNNWATTQAPNPPRFGFGPTGNILAYQYNSNAAANAWWYTAGLNLTGGTQYYVKFKYSVRSPEFPENLKVAYGTSPVNTAMTTVLRDLPGITDSLGIMDSVAFTPATTGVYYIGFNAYSDADQWLLFLDSVKVAATASAVVCNAPTGINAQSITTNSANIHITAPSPAASSYQYYVSTSNIAPTGAGTDTAWTPIMLTQLTPGTTYYFWIRSNCGNGIFSSWSSVYSFTTLAETCAEPTNVAINSISQTGASITFSAAVPAPAGGYQYVVSTSSGVPTGSGIAAAGSPITVGSLTPGTTYYVFIRSNCSNTTSAWTTVATFTTLANETCGDVSGITVTDVTTSGATVNFTAPTPAPANGYEYVVSTTNTTPTGSGTPVAGSPITLSGLNAGTTYYVFIRALCANASSGWGSSPAFTTTTATTCSPVTGLDTTVVNSTSADISFTDPNTGTAGYTYYISTTNTMPSTGTAFTGTSTTIGGLTASTTYYVWVVANCGTSESTATGPISFVTDAASSTCPAVNVRYEEQFESVTPPDLPTCTSIQNISGATDWVTSTAPMQSGFDEAGGNVLAYTYDLSVDANVWWFTRGINLTAGTQYYVSYKYGNNSTFYTENLKVGIGTSAAAASMTTILADHPDIGDNTAHVNVVNFTVPATGVYYVGFNAYSDADNYNLYLDSIVVDVPATCGIPTALSSSAITVNGATINFTAASPAPANGYVYAVSTTLGAPTVAGTPFTGTSLTLNTLNANTQYYVYIRAVCSGTDSSYWAGPVAFLTLSNCQPVNVRYEENFETAVIPAPPVCTVVENNGNSPNQWETATAPGANGFTAAGGKVLRYRYDFDENADTWWITRGINLTAGSNYFISYKYGNNSTFYSESMKVAMGTSQSSSSMTTVLADYAEISGGQAQVATVNFTVPTSGVYYFGFHAYSESNAWNLYLDSIVVDVAPTCLVPTNLSSSAITTSGATVTFDAPVTVPANGYVYYVSTTSTTPPAGTPGVALTGSPAVISGLNPNTTYYVFIKAACSATDSSYWSVPTSFLTLPVCAPLNVRYEQHFNGVTPPAIPVCTVAENLGEGNNWITSASPNANGFTAAGGNILRYNYSFSGDADAWWYTEGINLTAGTNYMIAYKYGNNSSFYEEKLKVAVGMGQTSSAMTQVLADHNPFSGAIARDTMIFFTVPTTGVYNFGFNAYSDANQFYIYLDSIIVDLAPTCIWPTGLSVVNYTNNSVQIDFTGATGVTNYEYYISTNNTAPTASTVPSGTTDSTGVVITGLGSATQYYIWIRSVCGPGDYSWWTAPVPVLTLCDPINTLPWTENFDAMPSIGLGVLPVCWKRENGDWRTANQSYTSSHDPHSAPNYLINSWSATNEYVWTPGFALQADSSYDFSFWFIGDGDSGWKGDIFVNSVQSSIGATQLGGSFIVADTTSNTTYKQIFRRFTPTSTGIYSFAIRINATFAPLYIGFDDFALRPSPQCYLPTTGIAYDQAYCISGTSGVPVISGTTGGYFTSSPGLVVDSTTGVFNPSATPFGTYAINYSIPEFQSCELAVFSDTIHIVPPPTASFSYPTSTICNSAGELVPTFNGQVNGTFSSTEGLVINPANGVITAVGSNGGSYVVTYTIPATNGCAEFTTTSNVTINAQSVAPQSINSSASTVCGNGSVDLSLNGGFLGTGASWQWYRDSCSGTPIGTGASLSNVSITQTTTIYVRAQGECNTTDCIPVTITHGSGADVFITASPDSSSSPLSPVVLTAHVSNATGPYFIQWYQDGNLLPNQNDSVLTVFSTNLGSYTAEVVSGTCASASNAIAVTLGTDQAPPTGTVFISPNPGNGVFNIRTPNDLTAGTNIKSVMVFDSKGARVYYKRFVAVGGAPFNMVIDIREAASGIYFVKLLDKNDNEVAGGKYLKSN